MGTEKLSKEIIERQKGQWFIEHIKEHFKEGEKVICKICNKDVDTIAKETYEKILKEFKKV